jgi:hypothetical protein
VQKILSGTKFLIRVARRQPKYLGRTAPRVRIDRGNLPPYSIFEVEKNYYFSLNVFSRVKMIESPAKWKWTVQTFFFGIASLSILLKYQPKKQS